MRAVQQVKHLAVGTIGDDIDDGELVSDAFEHQLKESGRADATSAADYSDLHRSILRAVSYSPRRSPGRGAVGAPGAVCAAWAARDGRSSVCTRPGLRTPPDTRHDRPRSSGARPRHLG